MFNTDLDTDIEIKDFMLGKGRGVLLFIIVLIGISVFLGLKVYGAGIEEISLEDGASLNFSSPPELAAEGGTPGEYKNNDVYVEVSGAVSNPGVYVLKKDARVIDALNYAQGFLSDASADWVSKNLNLAAPLYDSQKIYIPFEWDFIENTELVIKPTLRALVESGIPLQSVPSLAENQVPLPTGVNAPQETAPTPNSGINVNSASQSELESLHGIGKAYAERILTNRPYLDINELQEKTRIPFATLEKISDEITY